jgi:multiple sugar transport system permease protein
MHHTAKERTLWSIGILVVLLYALIPVAWITSLSFKTPDEVADRKFFSGFSFDNYDVVFSDDTFIAALINSIGIAGIATLISIVLAAMAAYATSRLDFAGKTLILSGALAVAMFPPISIVGSLFDMWRAIGIYDTWPGLIIPYMTFTLPLAIYTLSAFFREIPWELEQAPRSSSSSSPGTTSSSPTRSRRPTTRGRSRPRWRSSPGHRSSSSRSARSQRRRSS